MKLVELLKVFFYVFILLIAFAVLKALSTFEYSMRDKEITYEELQYQNFQPEGKKLIDKLKLKKGDEPDYLKMDVNLHDVSRLKIPVDTSFQFETHDTGYIELKLRTTISEAVSTSLVWIDTEEASRVITKLSPLTKGDQTIKSELIPFQKFHQLELEFDYNKEMMVAADTNAVFLLDYIKFVKEIKPKQYFF